MEFILLGRKKELLISALISFAANGIGGSTVYTALKSNNRGKKNYKVQSSAQ